MARTLVLLMIAASIFCILVFLHVSLYDPFSRHSSFVSISGFPTDQVRKNSSSSALALDPLAITATALALGVFSKIYVVSLPHRTERREQMERLRSALGVDEWTYFPAVSNESDVVYAVMQRVKTIREGCQKIDQCHFAWPDEEVTNILAHLDIWTSEFLSDPAHIPNLRNAWLVGHLPASSFSLSSSPLTCAKEDFSVPEYNENLKSYWLLTPARIACWHSHLSVVHLVANDKSLDSRASVLVLEDDVDMESDIRSQLASLWPLLPLEWDIVFLGHCWSNESTSIPIPNPITFSQQYNLYPSKSPKCTHAYALTRPGARRLLLHLRYAPFAYSRAIDQAIAWLIASGRLKAFSVVPSLVAQRKVAESDVMPGKGSVWKDELREGVLERLERARGASMLSMKLNRLY